MEFKGAQGVVRVHKRVNTIIHHDEPASRRCVFSVGEPGVHQDGDVMIPVQEDQRLFAENDEDCIAELWKL